MKVDLLIELKHRNYLFVTEKERKTKNKNTQIMKNWKDFCVFVSIHYSTILSAFPPFSSHFQ